MNKKKKPLTYSKAVAIVKEYYPELKGKKGINNFAGYTLWNFTGWPSFWSGDPEMCMREQIKAYADDPQKVVDEQESAWKEMSKRTKSI